MAPALPRRGILARNQGDDPTIDRMAADLKRLGATGSERDAIRALFALPYGYGQIAALVDRALQQARDEARL